MRSTRARFPTFCCSMSIGSFVAFFTSLRVGGGGGGGFDGRCAMRNFGFSVPTPSWCGLGPCLAARRLPPLLVGRSSFLSPMGRFGLSICAIGPSYVGVALRSNLWVSSVILRRRSATRVITPHRNSADVAPRTFVFKAWSISVLFTLNRHGSSPPKTA